MNAVFSVLTTNYYMLIDINDYIYFSERQYGNCSCAVSSSCIISSSIYDYSNTIILFVVPGMYAGCYIMESLLQSDLQCFYNQTCIDQIQSSYPSRQILQITPLNSSATSVYSTDSTIQELLNQLMIEEWNLNVMYNQYYNAFNPLQCTYSYQSRNDVIYIVTTLVGLVGGLITILKIAVPRFVQIIWRQMTGKENNRRNLFKVMKVMLSIQ